MARWNDGSAGRRQTAPMARPKSTRTCPWSASRRSAIVNVKAIERQFLLHGRAAGRRDARSPGNRQRRRPGLGDGLGPEGVRCGSSFARRRAARADAVPAVEPLAAADLASIPADAALAVAAKIDPLGLFNAYMQMLGKIDPGSGGKPCSAASRQMEAMARAETADGRP